MRGIMFGSPCPVTLNDKLSQNVIDQKVGIIEKKGSFYGVCAFFADYVFWVVF